MAAAITLVIVAFVGIPCCCICLEEREFQRKQRRIKSEISAEAYRDFTQNKASDVLKAELRRLFLSENNSMTDYLAVAKTLRLDVIIVCIRMIQVGSINEPSLPV